MAPTKIEFLISMGDNDSLSSDRCMVCHGEASTNVEPLITPCHHAMCVSCLLLYDGNNCPMCRTIWYTEPGTGTMLEEYTDDLRSTDAKAEYEVTRGQMIALAFTQARQGGLRAKKQQEHWQHWPCVVALGLLIDATMIITMGNILGPEAPLAQKFLLSLPALTILQVLPTAIWCHLAGINFANFLRTIIPLLRQYLTIQSLQKILSILNYAVLCIILLHFCVGFGTVGTMLTTCIWEATHLPEHGESGLITSQAAGFFLGTSFWLLLFFKIVETQGLAS